MLDIHTEDPIGVTVLKVGSPSGQIAEIGYMYLPEHQGKGFGSESLRAVMRYARDVLGLRALKGVVTEGNIAPCRVLEKCGLVLQQRQSNAFRIHGQLVDDLVYWHRIPS
jgi:RimJ/RimL family protein N-acetyltransferase